MFYLDDVWWRDGARAEGVHASFWGSICQEANFFTNLDNFRAKSSVHHLQFLSRAFLGNHMLYLDDTFSDMPGEPNIDLTIN